MLFDVGRASGTKLCCLLWNTNLVEIARAVIIESALVAILSSSTSVSKDNTGKEECLCRDYLFFRAPETVTTAKWQMSWKENSSLLRLWPYQGMKHTVSQNGEFIARYCYANDSDIYASAPLLASLFATAKFLSLFLLCHYY